MNEAVLGHRALEQRLERVIQGHADIDAEFAEVPQPGRMEALLVRRIRRLKALDLQPLRWRVRWSWRTRQIVRDRGADADVLFVNSQSCALLLTDVMRKTPTVLSVDATGREFERLGYWGRPDRLSRIAARPVEALERRALHGATIVMAWTEWVADSLRRDYGYPPERIAVVHPGIDAARFLSIERARQSSDGPLRVLFVGNHIERKGLRTLLDALPQVGRPVRVSVVTNDAVEASPGVEVHAGVVPDSDMAVRLFADSDVLALPTNADCVPHVVVEGMAAGLPVVSTPVGAIPELLGDAGVVTPVGDARALAAALRRLADDPDLRLELGAAGRRRVRERYDMAEQAERVVGLLLKAPAMMARR